MRFRPRRHHAPSGAAQTTVFSAGSSSVDPLTRANAMWPRHGRSRGRRRRGDAQPAAAQWIASVRAPPSVATSRSPGRHAGGGEDCAETRRRRHRGGGCRASGDRRGTRPARASARDERLALDADVAAMRRPDTASSTLRPRGVIAKIRPPVSSGAIRSPANGRSSRGATAIPPSTRGAVPVICVTVAAAVDRVDGRARTRVDRDQQAMPNEPVLVKRDPVDQSGCADARELPYVAGRSHRHDPAPVVQPQRVDDIGPEAALAPVDSDDIRLLAAGASVGRRVWLHRAAGAQQHQPTGGREHQRSVGPRSGEVKRAADMRERVPARGAPGALVAVARPGCRDGSAGPVRGAPRLRPRRGQAASSCRSRHHSHGTREDYLRRRVHPRCRPRRRHVLSRCRADPRPPTERRCCCCARAAMPRGLERAVSAYSRLGEHAACWFALGGAGAVLDRRPRAPPPLAPRRTASSAAPTASTMPSSSPSAGAGPSSRAARR